MDIFLKALWVGVSLCAASNAAAQTRLFRPLEDATVASRADTPAAPQTRTQRLVSFDPASLRAMRPGDEAAVESPDGRVYLVRYDRTEAAYGGGTVWVGHVRDYGNDYPVLISTYAGQVNGSIATPNGKMRLQGSERRALLTDMEAANERPLVPSMDDIVRAPRVGDAAVSAPGGRAGASATLSSATPGSPARVDLLILFTTQLQSQLGGYSAAIARMNLLVATANNVYANSGIYVSLSLVYAQAVNYAYNTADDGPALTSLQADPAVAALRNQYGADVVTMVRPFQASVCGLAFLTTNFSFSNYAFGVVEDGTNGGFYCDITTLTHEVGHLMGAAHDVATSVQNTQNCFSDPNHPCTDGYPSYNRGYCNGKAGTVMSYTVTANGCSPLAQYFSNPALNTCNSGACGVPIGTPYTAAGTTVTGADSTTAINANAPLMSVWRAPPTKLTSLVPARILDTRAGAATVDGLFSGGGKLSPNSSIDLPIAGRGGVPAMNVGAVVMNVTVTNPASAGYVTAWPTGAALPLASNINFVAGQTIPNLVVAKLGSGGKVSLFGGVGATDLLVDVAGWFPATSSFAPLVPARLLDTRPGQSTIDGSFAGIGAVNSGSELDFVVAGRGGVPSTGADSVVLNVVATAPASPGYFTIWPTGASRPNASSLNFSPNQTIANLVITKIGAGGKVALYNGSAGSAQVVADVAGWFPAGSELTSMVPARLLDTRPGMSTIDGQFAGGGGIGLGGELDLTVTGRAGIPVAGVGAVVLNVIAVSPTSAGYLTVWPAGSPRPLASNLNFVAGDVIPNLVIAKVGANGKVAIYNALGTTNVVADVVGWFAAP